MLRTTPLLLLALLLAAGCASTRPRGDAPAKLPAGFPNHSAHEIRSHIQRGADTLQAFRARASLTLRSPEQSGQFSSDLRSRRGDSLYLTISPGLGIEAARALVTPDSFFLYDRIQNRLLYGDAAGASRIFPIPLDGDDVFLNLLGLVTPPEGIAWRVDADAAHYYLRDPSGRQTYVVDAARWRVVRYEARSAAGEVIEEREFSEFDRFGALYLPRRVVFRRPLEDALAVVYYRDLTLNPGGLSFALRASASAERRRVE